MLVCKSLRDKKCPPFQQQYRLMYTNIQIQFDQNVQIDKRTHDESRVNKSRRVNNKINIVSVKNRGRKKVWELYEINRMLNKAYSNNKPTLSARWKKKKCSKSRPRDLVYRLHAFIYYESVSCYFPRYECRTKLYTRRRGQKSLLIQILCKWVRAHVYHFIFFTI